MFQVCSLHTCAHPCSHTHVHTCMGCDCISHICTCVSTCTPYTHVHTCTEGPHSVLGCPSGHCLCKGIQLLQTWLHSRMSLGSTSGNALRLPQKTLSKQTLFPEATLQKLNPQDILVWPEKMQHHTGGESQEGSASSWWDPSPFPAAQMLSDVPHAPNSLQTRVRIWTCLARVPAGNQPDAREVTPDSGHKRPHPPSKGQPHLPCREEGKEDTSHMHTTSPTGSLAITRGLWC